ncbi:MAG: hypothetical protein ISS69_11980, partial [Phycisphaerae bacterium]|nr:hypothetical protein [Phycisphaerae bacterium]
DQRVNAIDFGKARNNATNFSNVLKLITPPETGGASSAAMAIAPEIVDSNIAEAPENLAADNGGSAAVSPAETPMAIDLLTLDTLPAADTSSGASSPTVAGSDAAQSYAALQTPDSPEYGEGGLEIDLLADLDPLVILP